MKFIKLISFLLLLNFASFAQTGSDTVKYISSPNYGDKFKRLKVQRVFIPPTDTVVNKFGFAVLNGSSYIGNGTYWSLSSGGGGGGSQTLQQVYNTQSGTAVFTSDNTISLGNHTHLITGSSGFYSSGFSISPSQIFLQMAQGGGQTGALEITSTNFNLFFPNGQANISPIFGWGLKSSADTSSYKPMVWNPSTGDWRRLTYWPSGASMVYPGAGIPLSTGSAWGTSITDNSANWNTAYTDRNKWDGGATGLVPATGRTSLGLGTFATKNLTDNIDVTGQWNFRGGAIGLGTVGHTGLLVYSGGIDQSWDLPGQTGTIALTSDIPAVDATNITGILKGDGATISTAVAGTDYVIPSGSVATLTTGRTISGTGDATFTTGAFNGSANVSGVVTVSRINGTSLAGLATGILKNTTTTGVPSIAVAGDFPTLNQNTTGSAATLTTPRALYGNNFDGSAALTGIIASTYGGTGNGFTKISGPATSEKTFTLPNASATILTDNAAVTVAQGGTGLATVAANSYVKGNGTSALVPRTYSEVKTDLSLDNVDNTSDATKNAAAVTLTNKTLTTPVINGLATGTGVASAATASTIVTRDANANVTANNWLGGYTTTATAAGTTTLTVGSTYLQFFTGSTTQTVTLPVTSTLTLGHQFIIANNSSGVVTVQSSGANTVQAMAASTTLTVTCILTSGTGAASWAVSYSGGGSSTSTTDNLFQISSNVLTARKTKLALTDGATITWDASTGYNASVTLGGNRTLSITNPQGGDYYTIVITQDGTGFRTLTLPGGSLAKLNLKAAEVTTLNAYYDGTTYTWRSDAYDPMFVALTSTYTLSSSTSSQKLFNATTNGAITLQASTSYFFEADINLSSMSATSGNTKFDVLGAGTATVTSCAFTAWGVDNTTPGTSATSSQSFTATTISSTNIVAAGTGTGMTAHISGIIRINAAGTIIPSVALTTAAAAVVGVNTWFKITPIGSNTVTNAGPWN